MSAPAFTRLTRLSWNKCLSLPLLLVSLGGCASYDSSWSPVIDHRASKNTSNLQADLAECRGLAKQAADTTSEAAESGLLGALIGAAGGAAVGAIAGDAGIGAAIGATGGAIGGTAQGGMSADQRFKQAYGSCLRNRGYAVVQ